MDADQQTSKNTADIASLVSTVGQLASTVERHERMMVAGFDKLEHAMSSGMRELQTKMIGDEKDRESKRIPWWQLVLTVVSVVSISGGALIAFILFLNSSLAAQVDKLATESSRVAVVASNNHAEIAAQAQSRAERRAELDRIQAAIERGEGRDWDMAKLMIEDARQSRR